MSDAVIRDRGYEAYDGPREDSVQRVIAMHTVRTLYARKGVRRSVSVAFIPALISGVVTYVAHGSGDHGGDPLSALRLLTHGYGVVFPALLVALIAAGGTLAEDRRAGALSFYFARPVRTIDYLAGRLAGTAAMIGAACLAPPLCVALLQVALSDTAGLLRALLGVGVIAVLGAAMAVALASFALLAGAIASTRGAAQGFVALLVVVPWILAGTSFVDGPWLSLFSLPHLVDSIGRAILTESHGLGEVLGSMMAGTTEDKKLPAWAAVLGLCAMIAGSIALLDRRLARLSRESGV